MTGAAHDAGAIGPGHAEGQLTGPAVPVHVAGVSDLDEARMLVNRGIDAIGIPLVLGYHAEDLSAEQAADIIAELGRDKFFLITYLDDADGIAALCGRLDVRKVQLHGAVPVAELRKLRDAHPSLAVIKSLIVQADNRAALLDQVGDYADLVDAFITDTFDPQTGATGATGKTHDWRVSAELVGASPRPVILAGGLNPGNVREAIECVRPAAVDVHNGVEGPDGRKDPELVDRFLREVRVAYGHPSRPRGSLGIYS